MVSFRLPGISIALAFLTFQVSITMVSNREGTPSGMCLTLPHPGVTFSTKVSQPRSRFRDALFDSPCWPLLIPSWPLLIPCCQGMKTTQDPKLIKYVN